MKKLSQQELAKLTLSEQLRVVSRLGNFTTNELALVAGISAAHVGNGMHDRRDLKAAHIAMMAEYMGYRLQLVPIDQLDDGKDSDNG